MQKFTYNGCDVEIYESYYGDDLYITRNGEKVYSARVTRGQAETRMRDILG